MNSILTLIGAQSINELYVIVRWPYVQDLMEYEWFRKECFLYQAFPEQEYLPSAYFVPITRILAIAQPG